MMNFFRWELFRALTHFSLFRALAPLYVMDHLLVRRYHSPGGLHGKPE